MEIESILLSRKLKKFMLREIKEFTQGHIARVTGPKENPGLWCPCPNSMALRNTVRLQL